MIDDSANVIINIKKYILSHYMNRKKVNLLDVQSASGMSILTTHRNFAVCTFRRNWGNGQ